jgi:hypothetical protein
VAEEWLATVPYQKRPARHEYRLTTKGLDLYPAILALVHWGDRHYASKDGPPVIQTHRQCGHDFRSVMTCSECGTPVSARDVTVRFSTREAPNRRRTVARRLRRGRLQVQG